MLEKLYLTRKAVCSRYEISPTTLWRWCKNGHFPPGKKLGPSRTFWTPSELEEFDQRKGLKSA